MSRKLLPLDLNLQLIGDLGLGYSAFEEYHMTNIRFETLHVQIDGDMHRHDMPANCDNSFTAGGARLRL